MKSIIHHHQCNPFRVDCINPCPPGFTGGYGYLSPLGLIHDDRQSPKGFINTTPGFTGGYGYLSPLGLSIDDRQSPKGFINTTPGFTGGYGYLSPLGLIHDDRQSPKGFNNNSPRCNRGYRELFISTLKGLPKHRGKFHCTKDF